MRIVHLLVALLSLWAGANLCRAHNPDTSYTHVKISDEEIEFRFTLDITTLLLVYPIDLNQNMEVSLEEARQTAPAIYDFLREKIELQFDGKPVAFGEEQPPRFSENVPAIAAIDYHQKLIHYSFKKDVPVLPEEIVLIYRVFDLFGPRHANLALIEEPNQPPNEVIFSMPEPDYSYFINTPAPFSRKLWQFLKLGVKHIFLGYDHILFLLALIVVTKFWDLVKIITAFTVAHTMTLIIAALGVVSLPSRLIETGIALTIMYVALENIWIKDTRRRWVLTFFFGLVHGFGFANVLSELTLPTSSLVTCLLSFNLGVEIGQLAIVAALYPILVWIDRNRYGPRIKLGLSLGAFVFGTAWLIERAFNLSFMPI